MTIKTEDIRMGERVEEISKTLLRLEHTIERLTDLTWRFYGMVSDLSEYDKMSCGDICEKKDDEEFTGADIMRMALYEEADE